MDVARLPVNISSEKKSNSYSMLHNVNPVVASSALDDLKSLLDQNTKEVVAFVTSIDKEMREVKTIEEIISKKDTAKFVLKLKKLLEIISRSGSPYVYEAAPPTGEYPDKVVLFKGNMDYTLWEIKTKVLILNKLASEASALSEAIVFARTLRDVKKMIERWQDPELGSIANSVFRTERKLYIKLAEAKDLKAVDITGSVDPYAVISVDGDKKVQSPTIFKETNPTWLQEYNLDIPSSRSEIQIAVWDQKVLGTDTLVGQVFVPVENLQDKKPTEQWYHLMPAEKKTELTGTVHLRFKYTPNKNTIQITVIQASRLKVDSTPDTFCKVAFGAGDVSSQKTRVQKRSPNPIWNEAFDYYTPTGDALQTSSIDVSVWESKFSKNEYLGGVSIPISEIIFDKTVGTSFENWFKLNPRPPKKEKYLGAIRLKLYYLEETILPTKAYEEFVQLIGKEDFFLSILLGKISNASEEIVSALVKLFYTQKKELAFLKAAIDEEIRNTTDPRVIFRANSVATKGVDAYLKLIGRNFLTKVLKPIIKQITNSKQSCELDSTRIEKKDHKKNLETLNSWCTKIWTSLREAADDLPDEVKRVFHHIRTVTSQKWPEDKEVQLTAVSGLLFLRFLCPAILGPKQFGLLEDHPKEQPARNLTLISKVLMNLANLVEFGQKEPYMKDMNQFIVGNIPQMTSFLESLSNPSFKDSTSEELPTLEEDSCMAHTHHFFRLRFDDLQKSNPQHPLVISLSVQLAKVETFATRLEQKFKKKNFLPVTSKASATENSGGSGPTTPTTERKLSL